MISAFRSSLFRCEVVPKKSFVHKLTRTRKAAPRIEPEAEFKSTAVLPYIKRVSEPPCRCPQQQGIRAGFKSDTTLRSHLVRPKDTVDPAKQDGVVCRIPCECGKVYIGETGRSTARQGYTTRPYPDLHRL